MEKEKFGLTIYRCSYNELNEHNGASQIEGNGLGA